MIGKKISHYRIVEKISEGGMGSVYKAEDLTLGRTVAIKILKSSSGKDFQNAQKRFLREARVVSQVDHANIATLFDVFEIEQTYYLVMQYVPGDTLRQELNIGKIDPLKAVGIACDVAKGLEAAHKLAIVHRDIKPENIIITPDKQCKILDFGVARLIAKTTLTEKGRLIGTIPYMAPEQVSGGTIDARTDIYSLGLVLFEMLCGRRPFDQKEEVAVLYQKANTDPPSLRSFCPDIMPELDAVISKAIARDPEERYQKAGEMIHDLELIRNSMLKPSTDSREKLFVSKKSPFWVKAAAAASLIIVASMVITSRMERWHHSGNALPRIMVMKSINTTGDEDIDWLSGGIMDGLITSLGRLEGYQVISRHTVASSIKNFKTKEASLIQPEIFSAAKEVGADYLVTGNFARAGSVLRINCELNDLKRGVLVKSWNGSLANVDAGLFSIIDGFAADIASIFGQHFEDESPGKRHRGAVLTDSYEAWRYYQKALEFLEVGNYSDAADNFMLAVSADSTFAASYMYLSFIADTYNMRKRFLNEAMRYRSHSPSPLREIVEAAYQDFSGHANEAIKNYETILARYPEETSARISLAGLYIESRRFHDAVAEFALLRKLNPFDFSYYRDLWIAYVEIGRRDKAEVILKNWRERFPSMQAPLSELISFHQNTGEYETALDYCDSLALIAPGADRPYRGALLSNLGRIKEAENVLDEMLSTQNRSSNKRIAYSFLSYFYYRMNKTDKGILMIEKTLEMDKGAYNYWLAGLLFSKRKNFDKASEYAGGIQEHFTSSQIDSTAGEAYGYRRFYYHLKGVIALERSDGPSAVKMFNKALEFSSAADDPFFRTYLARAYLNAGEPEKAARECEIVLKFNPRYPEALLLLGRANIQTGNYKKAKEVLFKLDQMWDKADPDFSGKKELAGLMRIASS